jgi:type VI secretion system protein ImpG
MADLSFVQYYQGELAYYRELAQELARAHPEVAHLVSERGGDPAAERLFQGAALLTARLRQRVEDDFPEIVHPLFETLWSQHLRPIPSTTLLRFTAVPNALRQTQTVPRGTAVRSRALALTGETGSVECPFRTCAAVDLHPLALEQAALVRSHSASLQLRLRFRFTGGALYDNVQLRSLRLQLLGETQTKFTLYGWIAAAEQVSVVTPSGDTCVVLPHSAVRPVGLAADEALCPQQLTPLPNLHLLQEYLLFRDKFLAVEVRGLERVPAGVLQDVFELRLHLGNLPETHLKVDEHNIALGCVPAINLSESASVDIPVARGAIRFRLPSPPGGQVFAVERVQGYDTGLSDWVEYRQLFDLVGSGDARLPRYIISRQEDGVQGPQAFLLIIDRSGRPISPPTEALQVTLTTTNGALPARLGLGDVDQPMGSSPEYSTFANVTPVTPGAVLSLGRDRLWRLLAVFAMHPADLASRNGIEQLLREVGGASLDSQLPEIVEVSCRTSGRVYRRTMVPLRQVEIAVTDDSFSCAGQLYLFAAVISRLFAAQGVAQSPVFTEVTVRGVPSGAEYRFAAE